MVNVFVSFWLTGRRFALGSKTNVLIAVVALAAVVVKVYVPSLLALKPEPPTTMAPLLVSSRLIVTVCNWLPPLSWSAMVTVEKGSAVWLSFKLAVVMATGVMVGAWLVEVTCRTNWLLAVRPLML